MSKLLNRFKKLAPSILVILVIVAAFGWMYFWQYGKVSDADKKLNQATSQKADLSKQVTSLSNTVSSLQSKLKNSSTGPPLYKVGSTQCIKSFCITLDNDYLDPASNSPGGGLIQSDNLFSVELTVTNNGPVPSSHSSPSPNSEMGIPDGSLIYTSDNLFSGPYGGNGVATKCSEPRFGNDIYGYPQQGQTVKGCLTFEVPPNVTVDSYIYGNLTWVL